MMESLPDVHLDRDQRTTFSVFDLMTARLVDHTTLSKIGRRARNSSATFRISRWTSCRSACEAVVLSLCLLSTLAPRAMSAPLSTSSGSLSEEDISGSVHNAYQAVVIVANNALDLANDFKKYYVKMAFGTDDFEKHDMEWQNTNYDWLAPRKTTFTMEELQNLQPKEVVASVLEDLEKYSLALKLVSQGQPPELESKFRGLVHYLRTVLQEVRNLAADLHVSPPPQLSEDSIDIMIREPANRSLRDWIVFRDFIHELEYIVNVFTHLSNNRQH